MYLRSQIRFFLPIIFFLLPVKHTCAQSQSQSSDIDSISLAKTINNALAVYYLSAGDQSRLYNGTEYTGYPFTFAEGSPFFLTPQEQKGSIIYDYVEYGDVDLQYDEMMGVVIMQDANHRIQLSNERISRFTIGNYPFIRIVRDSLSHGVPETGFYNILYEGNLSVLKKEIKTIRQIYSYSQEITRVIDVKTNYYFRKNNDYTQINSQKELLNFFSDRKKEIQHFIKTNKLSFKKDTDNLLVKVAVYYDQQTK
jgi:hypothetical protein